MSWFSHAVFVCSLHPFPSGFACPCCFIYCIVLIIFCRKYVRALVFLFCKLLKFNLCLLDQLSWQQVNVLFMLLLDNPLNNLFFLHKQYFTCFTKLLQNLILFIEKPNILLIVCKNSKKPRLFNNFNCFEFVLDPQLTLSLNLLWEVKENKHRWKPGLLGDGYGVDGAGSGRCCCHFHARPLADKIIQHELLMS